MELCLGTVQFGMDYGIIGQKKPSTEYAVRCLDYATQNGISAIDTAEAYGTAEEIVGKFLCKKTIAREKLFLSTKLLPNCLDDTHPKKYGKVIRDKLCNSLSLLHTDYVDAFLLHSPHYVFNPQIMEALSNVKKEGLARKTGVSIYDPKEAFACYENKNVEFIQAPYSIFDQRMKERGVLDSDKKQGVEIHTRSAFIQGLITLQEQQIPVFLQKARPIIQKVESICSETGISRVELAMAYVKREKAISHLVFGIDSLEQLKEDIYYFQRDVSEDLLYRIQREFKGLDADIVMPSLWKK